MLFGYINVINWLSWDTIHSPNAIWPSLMLTGWIFGLEGQVFSLLRTLGEFSLKMLSYPYRNFYYKDKTVSSYFYNENPFSWKDGLYIETDPGRCGVWPRPLAPCVGALVKLHGRLTILEGAGWWLHCLWEGAAKCCLKIVSIKSKCWMLRLDGSEIFLFAW